MKRSQYMGLPNTVNPRPKRETRPSKATPSVNLRWTNLILHGINRDMGKRPWKISVNK